MRCEQAKGRNFSKHPKLETPRLATTRQAPNWAGSLACRSWGVSQGIPRLTEDAVLSLIVSSSHLKPVKLNKTSKPI